MTPALFGEMTPIYINLLHDDSYARFTYVYYVLQLGLKESSYYVYGFCIYVHIFCMYVQFFNVHKFYLIRYGIIEIAISCESRFPALIERRSCEASHLVRQFLTFARGTSHNLHNLWPCLNASFFPQIFISISDILSCTGCSGKNLLL